MRIALAQINTTIGAVEENARRCVEVLREAEERGADLVAFPELTLTGYPPMDLLERPSFIRRNLEALERVAVQTRDVAVVVGYAAWSEEGDGKPVQNAAALLQGGEVRGVARKGLLPTYDIFDEGRYFQPGRSFTPVPVGRRQVGLCICEDIWNYEDVGGKRPYAVDPVESLSRTADLILNISASPYSIGRPAERQAVGRRIAARYGLPVVLVNLVGGNDSIIFDGTSFVLGPQGDLLARAASFQEDLLLVDLEEEGEEIRQTPVGADEVVEALTLGLKDYVRKCGFRKVALGLSGGIDSSVVATIAARALGPSQVMGIAMPGPYSSPASQEAAAALAKALGIDFGVIPIGDIFQTYQAALGGEFRGEPQDIAEENIQARIRGNILMAISNRFGHLVLSTGNKSEMAVGYCTLYGDLSGGLAVISDVPKTLVYRLARQLDPDGKVIPPSVLSRPPSAELRPDQTDQDTLPPYEELDPILKAYVEENLDYQGILDRGHDPEVVRDVLARVDRNEYKRRQTPPGLRVSLKAFGIGRRLPIAKVTPPRGGRGSG